MAEQPARGPPMPVPPDDLPPELRRHPQYDIERELGRGGMGTVYLAKNKLMDRPEVLKVLNRSVLDRPDAAERFLREIRAAAKLNHPNVVSAHTALQLGDLVVLVMEYVPGEDLGRVVKTRGPLPVNSACYYVYQAALGMQHAHDRGMVHRDIKPGNLMLMAEGRKRTVKILDFGLAKASSEEGVASDLTGAGKILGTPDFIAPEQTLDATRADIRADVYSLGCTLFYLLAGKAPFTAASLYELLRHHQESPPPLLSNVRPDVPPELAAVVAKMMAKKPADRFPTPGAAGQALAPFFKPGGPAGSTHELPAVVVPPPPTPPAPPPPGTAERKVLTARVVATDDSLPARTDRTAYIDPDAFDTPTEIKKPRKAKAAKKARPGGRVPAVRLIVYAGAALAVVATLAVGYSLVGRGKKPDPTPAGPGPVAGGAVKDDAKRGGDKKDDGKKADAGLLAPPGGGGPVAGPDGFFALFNGKDFDGWEPDPDPDRRGDWRVEGGKLVGRGRTPFYLYSKRDDFGDVHVRARVKVNDGGNGGIYARCPPGTRGPNSAPRGYFAQIDATGVEPKARTGSLFVDGATKTAVVPSPVGPGVWFTLELILRGERVQVKVNGRQTAAIFDNTHRRGRIVLEVFKPLKITSETEIVFESIEVKELTEEAAAPPGADAPAGPNAAGTRFTAAFDGGLNRSLMTEAPGLNQGTWSIENGVLIARGGGPNREAHLWSPKADYADVVLRVNVSKQAAALPLMYVRAANANGRFTGYAVAYAPCTVGGVALRPGAIRKVVNGVPAGGADSKAAPTDDSYWVLANAHGNVITARVDGAVVAQFEDPSPIPSGAVGVACGGADAVRFNRIELRVLAR